MTHILIYMQSELLNGCKENKLISKKKSQLFRKDGLSFLVTLTKDLFYHCTIIIQDSKEFCQRFEYWLWNYYLGYFPVRNNQLCTIVEVRECKRSDGITVLLSRTENICNASIGKEKTYWRLLHGLLVKKIQNEYMSAYLSTIGGAHSSLGENHQNHAVEAGLVCRKQFILSLKMNDHVLMLRCQLFFAHSLLQQGDLKKAAKIIRNVNKQVKNSTSIDLSLVQTCCKAEWCKYVYLKSLQRKR